MVFGRYPNLKHLPNHFWSELRWLCKWAIRLYFGTLFLAVAVTQVRLPASARLRQQPPVRGKMPWLFGDLRGRAEREACAARRPELTPSRARAHTHTHAHAHTDCWWRGARETGALCCAAVRLPSPFNVSRHAALLRGVSEALWGRTPLPPPPAPCRAPHSPCVRLPRRRRLRSALRHAAFQPALRSARELGKQPVWPDGVPRCALGILVVLEPAGRQCPARGARRSRARAGRVFRPHSSRIHRAAGHHPRAGPRRPTVRRLSGRLRARTYIL